MKVEIDVDDRAVVNALNRLVRSVEDPSPAMRAIGAAMSASAQLRFRDGADPDGAAWAPLSPVTIALRRKGSSKPLLDTGLLSNSITYALQGRDSVVVGTNDIRAKTLHFGAAKGAFGATKRGAPIPWGNIPARPFLGVSDDDRDEIVDIVRNALQSAIR